MSLTRLKKYPRLALTGYHLLYSIVLSIIITGIIYFIWYPNHLYQATGVLPTALMMIALNLIVAPLLTFIVYKDNKKELIRDLVVILALQIAALSYGLYIVEAGRPAYLVFAEDSFEVVRVFDNQWAQSNLSIEIVGAQPLGLFERPKFVYSILLSAEEVESHQKTEELTTTEFATIDFEMDVPTIYRTDSYQKIETAANIIQSKARPLTTLTDSNSNKKVQEILHHYPNANGWLPLKATTLDMVVLIDKEGVVVDIADLQP